MQYISDLLQSAHLVGLKNNFPDRLKGFKHLARCRIIMQAGGLK